MSVRDHQLHPYLRACLRSLESYGYCIVENGAIQDEEIMSGYNSDDFNNRVVEHFDGQPFLMDERPNGDLVIKAPSTPEEQRRALQTFVEMARSEWGDEAFSERGVSNGRRIIV